MSDEELYDEFGNYIGPDLDSSSDEDDDSDRERESYQQQGAPDEDSDVSDHDHGDDDDQAMIVAPGEGSAAETADPVNAIVLHEDKVHYPSAQEVYGEEVRTAVLDEDLMDIDTPIIEPVVNKTNRAADSGGGEDDDDYVYSDDYLTALLANESTTMRRGFALVGHLHSGKTTFCDFLLECTRKKSWGHRASLDPQYNHDGANGGSPRYLDTLQSEQDRQMSLVSTPCTMLLPDTRGKSHVLTLLDCPGHANFHDETVAALRTVDGAVIVLDAVEGIMLHTEMAIRQAVTMEGLPLCLLINKVDRLIVELKLPPRDCYFKLLNLIDSVNLLVQEASQGRYPKISPERGNVAFASSQHGWCFTTSSFAQLYLERKNHQTTKNTKNNNNKNNIMTVDALAKRLWGDAYWDPMTRKFHKSSKSCTVPGVDRTFVVFILQPLYKIYSACLGEPEKHVSKVLRQVGVYLNRKDLRASARPLLRSALSKFFETAKFGFVDMVVKHFPSPAVAAHGKLARCYSGPQDSENDAVFKAMLKCDANGPLMIQCAKLYSSPNGQSFSVLGRVFSGTVRPGETLKILGEAYSLDDEEDMATATLDSISIPRGRHQTQITRATAGNWVLLDGVDATIAKTATITSVANPHDVHIFSPLQFPQAGGEAVMKLAIEPLNPAELPKMVEGLRGISKAYPMARTRVEESGEHVLFGTGELYMDCMMHDLRHVYSDIEVKVADPVVAFRETVVETSSLKCFAETANSRNKLTFIAEPLDDGLAEQLEIGKLNIDWGAKKLGKFFQSRYDWDLLAARSVWAFGSSSKHGTNLLLDDTLPSEIDKRLLNSCKSSIVQGFQWATREGPLCEEPVRGTKIKVLDATLADKPIYRGGGQIIPTARRVVHSSILTATPRLMEPIYRLQIQCPPDIVDALQPVLTRRRGHIVQEKPISGSLLSSVKAFLPVLDSFGFETDLRLFTQGQAMVHSVFDHWDVVPGDPLDRSIVLHPLEPSPRSFLAREILVKTRRRKGLSEDVSVSKFFDDEMKAQLNQDELMSLPSARVCSEKEGWSQTLPRTAAK